MDKAKITVEFDGKTVVKEGDSAYAALVLGALEVERNRGD